MKKLSLLLAALCLPAAIVVPAAAAQEAVVPPSATSSSIDWPQGVVAVEVALPVDQSTPSLVRAKAEAETDIESRLPEILAGAVASLTVDSSHSLGDLLDASPQLFARVNDLLLRAPRTELFLLPDFSSLVARYSVPLFGASGIASALAPSAASPIRRLLGEVTTRKYSGVVIYAKGMLPEVGTGKTARARPALFPRLWNEQMDLVLDRGMCSPEAIARWGMVGYAASLDDAVVLLRAGAAPLRIAARGVFGDKDTDIVIPTDAARQLLALMENITLLREGRIVVIYDSLP